MLRQGREPSWQQAAVFGDIKRALAAGKKVLVYCKQGKNRSPIICVVVLAPVLGGIDQAAQWIRSLRNLCRT